MSMSPVDRTVEQIAERLAVPIRRARAISNPPEISPAPQPEHPTYDPKLAQLAARVLYRSGIDSLGNPLLVLSAAAFPDAREVDYNLLLPYVLAILPGENEIDELDSHGEKGSGGYSVIFFAGGGNSSRDKDAKTRPTWSWFMQAYSLLGRAVRKRIKKLWVVHERAWVRIMLEMLSGVVSQKFRRKVLHVGSLTELALEINITKLNIPPAVYLHDKRVCDSIQLPGFPPPPQFGRMPFTNDSPVDAPLPHVLTDASRFIRLHCLSYEGIFRKVPSTDLLEIAREAYDRRQNLHLSDYGPNIAAALIKLYYRTLPDPIIPTYCYEEIEEQFNESTDINSEDAVVAARSILTQSLPKVSCRLLLRHLLPLLALVASHNEVNRMTAYNLAVCLAPSMLRSENIMLDARLSRGGVGKLLECLIVNIEQFAPKMPDRQPKPAALTGDKYLSISSIKRSAATASNIRKQMNAVPRINGDSPVSKYADDDLLTSSPIQRKMSWTPITQTIMNGSPAPPRPTTSEGGGVHRVSHSHNQTHHQLQAQPQPAPVNQPSESAVTNGGIPSPPPSPTKDTSATSTPARPIARTARSESPPKLSSSPPGLSSSPSSKLSSSPSKLSSSPSRLSSSPGSGPQIRGLMRATSSPLPPRDFRSTLSVNNNNNKPTLPTLRKVPSDAAINWQKAGGRVKVAGSMVNELKALYEERAKGASILVKTGSRRGQGTSVN
ncbi:Myosin-IXa [Orbilia brochopaga]|nr:Myosin-IXa [Drechslerella brochopaga]